MAGFGPNLPPVIRVGAQKPNAGPRQSAIAHHMGAPKAAPKPAGKPKATAPPKAAPRPAAKGLGSSQKAIGTLNPGDVVNQSVTRARQERNVALAPLQSQAKEIGANEQGVQQRYGQLVGGENEQFQKIGEQQAASAKTFQNQMAENALQQAKSVETAGQTQATMTGGYASPELRAQLMGEAQLAGQQGGAGNQFAQNIATSGAANIANMRGAAALNALGGSQNITGVFQKQLAANQQAQQGVLGKVGPRTTELEEKIGQTNFADQAAKAKLAHENIKIGQAGQKIAQAGKIAAARNATSRANSAESVAQRERANQRSTSTSERDTIMRIQAQVGKSSKATKTAKGSLATHDALNKLSAELGSAYQGFVEGRTGKEKLTPAEIRQNLTVGKEGKKGFPKAVNQVLITAAQELYYTHKVSKATRAAMGKLGMNIGYDNEAFHAVSGK